MAMLLRLAYDGTEFHGFARQTEVRTVQGELDFAGFRAADCQAKHTRRRVRSVDLQVRSLAELDPLAHDGGRIDEPHAPALLERGDFGERFDAVRLRSCGFAALFGLAPNAVAIAFELVLAERRGV
jgi:hypothetical protein